MASGEGRLNATAGTQDEAKRRAGPPDAEANHRNASIDDAVLINMTKEDVRRALDSPETNCRTLMAIAQHRFGASGGTLSRLTSDM